MKKVKKSELCMSLVSNHTKIERNISVQELYDLVKGDTYKTKADGIKALYQLSNKEHADELKKSLPAVTVSGTFNEHRKTENLNTYSGYVCLDIDDLDPGELSRIKTTVQELPYTVMAFTSPSGFGIKIIVQVNTGGGDHKTAYKQVQAYYEKELDCVCDKTNDVARLCYVSHDPDAYLNEEAEVFQVAAQSYQLVTTQQPVVSNQSKVEEDYRAVFEETVVYSNRKAQFEPSNRNKYIHLLSCNCNRKGIPQDITCSLVLEKYVQVDFTADEITRTVTSAYENNKSQFATWKKDKTWKSTSIVTPAQSTLGVNHDTICMSDEVYTVLPGLLMGILSSVSDKREKDVALTASLVILSSMLPKVYGHYDGKVVHPNLYGIVLAPPANNKGIVKGIHDLFNCITENYRIPGNATSTVIIDYLKENSGTGLIYETELDALGYLTNKDSEGFAHIANNSFHHEPINISRKSMDNTVWVDAPKLSMLLSGIPQQAASIIKATHDGIFSRFIPYVYDCSYLWKDMSDNSRSIDPQAHASEITAFKDFIRELQQTSVRFEFTGEQWNRFNDHYSSQLLKCSVSDSSDMSAVVKRMGLINFRIAMILSVLRCYENGEAASTITCSDEDFNNSVRIASTYMQHAEIIYNGMEGNKEKLIHSTKLKRLYDVLPNQFDRKTAVELAAKNSIHVSDRTVDNYLKRLVTEGMLEYSYNKYQRKVNSIPLPANQKLAA